MTNALRKIKRHSILDDPTKWSSEIRPPYFDAEAYQARLDARVGLNHEGKSILRVVWAPESIGLYGIPRYWITRVRDGEGWKYTSVPRWVFESRVERSQYAASWTTTRLAMSESDGYVPTEPPDDFHMFRWLCAEHESPDPLWGQPRCCRRAWEPERLRCWGTYRAPNDYDLACVSKALQVRERSRFINPYEPLSVPDLMAIEAASMKRMEALAQNEQAEVNAMGRDFDKRHAWRLRHPGKLDEVSSKDRFFDMGNKVVLTDS